MTAELTFIINPNGKLGIYRDCPICEKFYEDHPTLKNEIRLRQKQRKSGGWYHTSRWGRKIHNMAIKELGDKQ